MTPKHSKNYVRILSVAVFASSLAQADVGNFNNFNRGSSDSQTLDRGDRGGDRRGDRGDGNNRGGNNGRDNRNSDRGGNDGRGGVQQPPRQEPPRQQPPPRQEPPRRDDGRGRGDRDRDHRPPPPGGDHRYQPPPYYPPQQPPRRWAPPIRHVRPVRPLPPRYIPDLPIRRWNPQRPGGPGFVEREYEYLGRVIENSEVPLRELFDIGREFYGYSIDSVQVEVRDASFRSSRLSLEVNGRSVDSEYDPQGWVTLDPGIWDEVGSEVRTLRLDVRGRLFIGGIYINLRRFSDGPNTPPAYETVQLSVPGYMLPRRMLGNDRIGLGQLINLNDYVGYYVQEIMIQGEAVYNNAILDVLVSGIQVGSSLLFNSNYPQTLVFRPNVRQNIGYGYDTILFMNRGDLNIRQVTLTLSRW